MLLEPLRQESAQNGPGAELPVSEQLLGNEVEKLGLPLEFELAGETGIF
jgi:hypothetical protein